MLPDDDKRYAIETSRSSEKWFKINDIQLVHLLVMWYLVNLQDAQCNNKDTHNNSLFFTSLESFPTNMSAFQLHVPCSVFLLHLCTSMYVSHADWPIWRTPSYWHPNMFAVMQYVNHSHLLMLYCTAVPFITIVFIKQNCCWFTHGVCSTTHFHTIQGCW